MLAIEIDKERLREFCRKWKITELSLFGSATRPEEFRADSDVDVLVTFAEDAKLSLFDLVHMRVTDDLPHVVDVLDPLFPERHDR